MTQPAGTQTKKWGDKFKEWQITIFFEQVVKVYLPLAGAISLVWVFLTYDLGMKKYEAKDARAEADAQLRAQRIESPERKGWLVSIVAQLEGKSKATMHKSAKCIELLVGRFARAPIPQLALIPVRPDAAAPVEWLYAVNIVVTSTLASDTAKKEAKEKCKCAETPKQLCMNQSDAAAGELRGQDKNVDQLDFWLEADADAWIGYTANYLLTTEDEQPGYWISNAGFVYLDPAHPPK